MSFFVHMYSNELNRINSYLKKKKIKERSGNARLIVFKSGDGGRENILKSL